MSPSGQDALQAETTFLECVASRFGAARPKPVPGRFFRFARLSQTDQVKAAMVRRGLYDRELLAGLPHNRSLVFHGYQPRLFGLSRQRTGRLTAFMYSILPPENNSSDFRIWKLFQMHGSAA